MSLATVLASPSQRSTILAAFAVVLCYVPTGASAAEELDCWSAADCIEEGLRLEREERGQFAVDHIENACTQDDAKACAYLGYLMREDRGREKDPAAIAKWLQEDCNVGDAVSCYFLARLEEVAPRADHETLQRLALLRAQCNAASRGMGGDAQDCYRLGGMYRLGDGVPQDSGEAARLYRRACDRGIIPACSALGYMYWFGYGVPADAEEAARLSRIACDANLASACTNLASQYARGQGVETNYVEAARLYARALRERLPLWLDQPEIFWGDVRGALGHTPLGDEDRE